MTNVLISALLLALPVFAAKGVHGEEVHFAAADGVTVYADLYQAPEGKSAPLIILYHQARSNARGEYGPIIPRLTALGYNVLAVDQRSGGSLYGYSNRTVDALGASTDYCSAWPDVVAALDYAIGQGFSGPRIAWGSSYSAALVLRLAHERGGDLAAVLAFSPASGPGMGPCSADNFIDGITVPLLALSPASEMRYRQQQFARLRANGAQTYVAENGVHGSSMLVPGRTHADTSATWAVVTAFLQAHDGRRHEP